MSGCDVCMHVCTYNLMSVDLCFGPLATLAEDRDHLTQSRWLLRSGKQRQR